MVVNDLKGPGVDRLFSTGAHFAQVKSRRHPSMKKFIVGVKSKVEIFDLSQTDEQLAKAKAAIAAMSRDGKVVMFVGGKREITDAVRKVGERLSVPYVAGRWLGGTITNFVEIKKRIDRLADLEGKKESGELAKLHTKLERVFIDREIARLAKRPDAMVVVDTRQEAHAVKEARAAGIPIIGIMSSDCDLADAAFPIVTNDASRATVALVLEELAAAYEEGKKA